jgi:hypothetical protein
MHSSYRRYFPPTVPVQFVALENFAVHPMSALPLKTDILGCKQMSALGHKQTCAVQKVMSALPPKADIGSAQVHVRFVPKADIEGLWDIFRRTQECAVGQS